MPDSSPKTASANFTFYPLFWLSVCFALGIPVGRFTDCGPEVPLVVALVSAVLTAILLKKRFAVFLLALAFAAAGAFCSVLEGRTVSPDRLKRIYDEKRIESGEPVEIEGVLQGNPEPAAGGFFLALRAEKVFFRGEVHNTSGTVRLFAPAAREQAQTEYERLGLQHGSRIVVACHLRREDSFLNPGVIPSRESLDYQGIDAVGTVKSPLLVEKIGDEAVFTPLLWLYRLRQHLIGAIHEKFSVSTAGVLIASLLGDKYFLDRSTAEVFREGGTFHVLVISGLHITFIGGLILLPVTFLTKSRFRQFLLAAAFLWAYAVAVGAESPVVRAGVMYTILLFARVIYRESALLNALGFSALILLAWRPADLFSPSFQLTFVSMTAIVAFAFPLIENLRAIGAWRLSADTPFPPTVPGWLRRFCETLYWREEEWKIESRRRIWSARLFKSPYCRWPEEKGLQGLLRFVFESLLVSMAVQMWLLPLLVVYFHRVTPASVLLNLWVGVLIALESFAAFLAIGSSQISDSLAVPFIYLTEIFNRLLVSIPGYLVHYDGASIRVPVYAGSMRVIYLAYFLPLLMLSLLIHRWKPFAPPVPDPQFLNSNVRTKRFKLRSAPAALYSPLIMRRLSVLFLLLSVAVIIFHPWSAPGADGRLRIDFLDVGQGDAALVTFPTGETLLVDGGGRAGFNRSYIEREGAEPEPFEPDGRRIGEAVVSEFLWEKGYSQIDFILATHAHADHVDGLIDVARNFRIRAAFFGRMPAGEPETAELVRVLRERDVEVMILARGDVLTIGGVKMEVLYPEAEEEADDRSVNDLSLVLRLNFGAKKFLLTGDIERAAESDLLQHPAVLAADVVKVAHHGSRTSSTPGFVEATRAQYAVIPVGRDSPFGHPHPEISERWKRAGARLLTTGESGTISVSTDGKDLMIETFSGFK